MEKTCPICGEPTYLVYGKHPRKDGLCYKHSQMFFNKEIEQCPDCGKWHDTDEECECKKPQGKTITQKEEKPFSEELTCIICGKPSNGKHFCLECYKKYKNRSVDLRITNCIETKVIDDYGNLTYKCNDGRKVRSRAEKIISDELFNLEVLSIYEETINYYPNENETIELHPDFYLPQYELYIEYNELKNKPYLKSKEYTQKIYKELNKKVVIMTEKDLEDVKAFLKKLLKKN